jgi:molybdopterin-guanine dinucleotide biosynthesis protein A
MEQNCKGYVLTGGRSSRMGKDKALLPFEGMPLASHMARIVLRACGNATLVGSRSKYSGLGWPVIEDVAPGHGPLSGIHAALLHALSGANESLLLMAGCDMPFVTADFLAFLLQIAKSSGADAIVPQSQIGYEPLCAVYTAACLPAVEAAIRSGTPRISSVLDAAGRLFANLNAPEDYERALTSAERVTPGNQ